MITNEKLKTSWVRHRKENHPDIVLKDDIVMTVNQSMDYTIIRLNNDEFRVENGVFITQSKEEIAVILDKRFRHSGYYITHKYDNQSDGTIETYYEVGKD